MNIEVCCYFATGVLCCLDTVLAHFGFHPLLFFAYEVLPCFVYTVIIINTVVLKTNNWGLKVTDTPAKRRSVICPFFEVFRAVVILHVIKVHINTLNRWIIVSLLLFPLTISVQISTVHFKSHVLRCR